MAALAKITVSFGVISAQVAVHNALLPKVSNVTVCTGTTGKPEHAPVKLQQKRFCTDCLDHCTASKCKESHHHGEVAYTEAKKARDVAGGLVVLEDTEIKSAKVDSEKTKKSAALTPHPIGDVDAGTVPGEKLYHLVPEAGQEMNYAVIRHLVESRPDLAFMCLWTPRSAVGQFVLRVRDGVLVMQERVLAAATKAAPQVNADAPEKLLEMAEQVLALPGMVADFDPANYADTYEENIQLIVASKTPVPAGAVAPVVKLKTSVQADPAEVMAANLLATIEAAGGKQKKKKATAAA